MADISKDTLRREITAILKTADLKTTSAKKVRQQIEEKLDVNLTERKKEVDDLLMECLEMKQESDKGKNVSKKRKHEEEDSEEEDCKDEHTSNSKPSKSSKKARSDDSSDDNASVDSSDDNVSVEGAKKAKVVKKGKGKVKKQESCDSDNDSDGNLKKRRRAAARPAKKVAAGGKRGGGGGGYTRAYTLSPELSAIMGQESMARHEVVRKVWSIIKEENLYDPKNKQFVICDDKLLKVFGVKRFRAFGMMKYLKTHFQE